MGIESYYSCILEDSMNYDWQFRLLNIIIILLMDNIIKR